MSNTSPSLRMFDQALHLAFPPAVVQLIHALVEPEPLFSAISKYISMDPVLVATTLNIVNSSEYGFTSKITDISQAVRIIGTKELLKIVTTLLVQKQMRVANKRSNESLYGDWRLTMWAAIAAEEIAKIIAPEHAVDVYISALLKDIPLMLAWSGDNSISVEDGGKYITLPTPENNEREKIYFGQSHESMAADMLICWEMPKLFIDLVSSHHDINNLEEHTPAEKSLLLGTRWSELMHGFTDQPGLLISFEANIGGRIGLNAEQVERLRSICAQRFASLTNLLGIKHGAVTTRYYEHSLNVLKDLYFFSLEIHASSGMISDLANTIFNQLKYYWGVESAEIILMSANKDNYFLFKMVEGTFSKKPFAEGKLDTIPLNEMWDFIALSTNKTQWGLIGTPKNRRTSMIPSGWSLPVYGHFLSLAIDNYYSGRLPLEMDALFLEKLPMGFGILGRNGEILRGNKIFMDLFRLVLIPPGMTFAELCYAKFDYDIAADWRIFANSSKKNMHWTAELKNKNSVSEEKKQNRKIYFAIHSVPELNEYIVVMEDISVLQDANGLTATKHDFLYDLFITSQKMIIMINKDGSIAWASVGNENLVDLDFFSAFTPLGEYSGVWNSSMFDVLAKNSTEKGFNSGRIILDVKLNTLDAGGNVLTEAGGHPYELHLLGYAGTNRDSVAGIGIDLARLYALEEKLKEQSNHDSLTHLGTHSQFYLGLEKILNKFEQNPKGAGVIFLNLVDFTTFNKSYGYRAGDNILKLVGEILEGAIHPGSGYAYRYGGDEFAILIDPLSEKSLQEISEKITVLLEARFKNVVKVSVSGAHIKKDDKSTILQKINEMRKQNHSSQG